MRMFSWISWRMYHRYVTWYRLDHLLVESSEKGGGVHRMAAEMDSMFDVWRWAKPNGSILLLYKWADTAFWLFRADPGGDDEAGEACNPVHIVPPSIFWLGSHPEEWGSRSNTWWMPGQRLQRWPSIHHVFSHVSPALGWSITCGVWVFSGV